MSKKIRTEAVDYLFEAILSLKNKGECYTFFEDICRIIELHCFSICFMNLIDNRDLKWQKCSESRKLILKLRKRQALQRQRSAG